MATLPDKLPHVISPFTARELLTTLLGEEHALCSVRAWGEHDAGGLWIFCTCGGYARCLDEPENRLALRNMVEID